MEETAIVLLEREYYYFGKDASASIGTWLFFRLMLTKYESRVFQCR